MCQLGYCFGDRPEVPAWVSCALGKRKQNAESLRRLWRLHWRDGWEPYETTWCVLTGSNLTNASLGSVHVTQIFCLSSKQCRLLRFVQAGECFAGKPLGQGMSYLACPVVTHVSQDVGICDQENPQLQPKVGKRETERCVSKIQA